MYTYTNRIIIENAKSDSVTLALVRGDRCNLYGRREVPISTYSPDNDGFIRVYMCTTERDCYWVQIIGYMRRVSTVTFFFFVPNSTVKSKFVDLYSIVALSLIRMITTEKRLPTHIPSTAAGEKFSPRTRE